MTGCFIIGASERTGAGPLRARKRAGVQPGEKRPMISKQPGMDVPAVGYEKAALQLPGSQRRPRTRCARKTLMPSEIHQSEFKKATMAALIGGRQPIELAKAAAN